MKRRPDPIPLRLLHIEDSPADSELVQATLEADGFAVKLLRVETGDEAREALAAGGFDLILSDFSLPRFNGLEALVLAVSVAPDIPFILVSGTIGEDAAIESLRGGATDYVLKHRPSRLGPAVRRALKEAADRRVLRQAERELERERHFLRAVLESVRTGIIACDAAGRLTLFNRAAREIHGVAADASINDLVAERFWLLDADGHARVARLDVGLQRVLRGEEFGDSELVVVPRGAPRRRVVMNGRKVAGDAGEKLGAVVALHDVSEERDLIEQLRHAQKAQAVGRLVGGLAQDFNNVLTAIVGYAQLSARRIASGGDASTELVEIERAAARGSELTRQLRSFSRIEEPRPCPLDLDATLAEMEGLLVRVLGEDIELRRTPAGHPGFVLADPGQIEQIVLNLAMHARERLPNGGRVEIVTSAPPGAAGPDAPPGTSAGVMLEIRDDGAAMDDSLRRRLFEPFLPLDGGRRNTGLDLSVVHAIVRQCGGHIEVESPAEGGLAFRIGFPRMESPGIRRAITTPRPAGRGWGRILVVEEDRAVRGVVVHALRMHGYTVIEAPRIVDVPAVLDTDPFDLMLADRSSGAMAVEHLAARLAQSRPPVATVFLGGGDGTAADAIPGARVLPKPFTVDDLIRCVRESLAKPSAEAA